MSDQKPELSPQQLMAKEEEKNAIVEVLQEVNLSENPEIIAEQIIERVEFMHYRGPVMHPEIAEHYERVLPGSADRIIKLTEKEQSHAHHIVLTQQANEHSIEISDAECRRIDAGCRKMYMSERARGQWLAFASMIVLLGFGTYIIKSGFPWPGGVISVSSLVIIIKAFMHHGNNSDNPSTPEVDQS